MSQELDIVGAGGGKGGGGASKPIEENDTLSSHQTIKLLLAICEGKINGIEDVFLNRVSYTKFDASIDVRLGTSNQTTIPGFVNTEAQLPSFTPLEITTVTEAGPYNLSSDVDAVRLTFFTPSLSQYLENGDLVGNSLSLSIWVSLNGVSYTFVKSTSKSGKASSEYAWDVQIERPTNVIPGNAWYIKVIRNTADSSSVKINNKTHISSVQQIYYKNLTYPGTALVAITMRNADQFGGQVPEISVKGKFQEVKVPNNYDVSLRTYSGFWDLGFNPVKQFTTNIAWVIFDVLNNPKCLNIHEADIDKASFYMLSQYADQLIDDGAGNLIPRYEIGYQFFSRENVPSFLVNLLSLCNAQISTNAVGQQTIVFDHAGIQQSKIITNANVIDGLFNYSSNDLEGRTTQVNVTFNDFAAFGDTSTATIPDETPTVFEQELIDRYGLQPSDIVLPGCTHKARAMYKARWALYTNCITTKFISFKVMLQGLQFYYGEVLQIMDGENRQVNQYGVILNSTYSTGITTIYLDRTFDLSADVWTISYTGADGLTLYDKTINQTNTSTNIVTFSGDFAPYINSTFILNGPIEAKLYKVTGIQKEDDYYVIAGIEHDENKYDYIDDGIIINLPTGDFVNVSDFTTEPVVNLVVYPIASSNGITSNSQLHVAWDWDLDHSSKFAAGFIASWRRDSKDFITVLDIQGKSFDIDNAVPGTYEINVWSVHPATNVRSTVLTTVYNYRTVAGTSSLLPPVNASTSLSSSTLTFTSAALTLYFYYNAANYDIIEDSLKDYVVELWTVGGTTALETFYVTPDADFNGIFRLPFADNNKVFGTPTRQFQIKLYSRDLIGDLSVAYSVTVNNVVPAAASFGYTLGAGVGAAYFNITASTENDVAGYIIHRSTSNTFPTYDIYDVGGNTVPVIDGVQGTTYYYRVAAYDTFGKTGLDFGSTNTSTLLSASADTYTYTGLVFKANDPTTNSVSWTSFVASKNGASSTTVVAGNTAWTTGILYLYYSDTDTTLNSTTSLATAVTGRILATYKGGLDLTHDFGKAFIDGDSIYAGSIGANQLVTGSAVVTGSAQIANGILTTAHIQDAAITNAKIANTIQSAGWDNTGPTYAGWQIDKAGNITSYGNLAIKDTAGNDIITTGVGAGVKWASILDKTSWVQQSGITVANASTFIENGAINNLMFDRSTGNKLSVGYLDIQGYAVIIPVSATNANTVTIGTTYQTVLSVSVDMSQAGPNSRAQILFRAVVETSSGSVDGSYYNADVTVRIINSANVVIASEPVLYPMDTSTVNNLSYTSAQQTVFVLTANPLCFINETYRIQVTSNYTPYDNNPGFSKIKRMSVLLLGAKQSV